MMIDDVLMNLLIPKSQTLSCYCTVYHECNSKHISNIFQLCILILKTNMVTYVSHINLTSRFKLCCYSICKGGYARVMFETS